MEATHYSQIIIRKGFKVTFPAGVPADRPVLIVPPHASHAIGEASGENLVLTGNGSTEFHIPEGTPYVVAVKS